MLLELDNISLQCHRSPGLQLHFTRLNEHGIPSPEGLETEPTDMLRCEKQMSYKESNV